MISGSGEKTSKKIWQEKYKKSRERKEKFETSSGLNLEPLYTPEDDSSFNYDEKLGFPGEFPYTRGVRTSMYRGRLWTMRQFSGLATARETNKRYHFLLERGQTGLSVAFDLPTLMGYDSDDSHSLGEVGKCGVAIDTLKDMETLFDRIPLEKISTSMTINGPASILFAMYIAVGEKQGVSSKKLQGTIQNDILKEYIAQKSWIYPVEPSMRIITDIMEFCSKEVPKWNTISISGYHIREAGSTALQELAFTLADGMAYVEAGMKAGMDVDVFAPRLSFFFDSHNNFFEEIAKFRAARRIWAKKMKNVYGAKKPESHLMRFHTQTAGCTLTAQQPENNIVRVAFQALSAVLGGTQSLHTNSMDETLALPTEKAVQIALRTQQVIASETGVSDTIDPLGGSYYIEYLTGWFEEECEKYFKHIEEQGGVIEAIKKGFFQREIAKSAYSHQKAVEKKKQIIVGLNDYTEGDSLEIPLLKIDPEFEAQQVKELKALKESRDNLKVKETLENIKSAASSKENLMPVILEAVRAYASLGEIARALKDVFGVYREPIIF